MQTGIYAQKIWWKFWVTIAALVIIGLTAIYTHYISSKLEKQEHERMTMISEFMKLPFLIPPEVQDFDFTIVNKMADMNTDIPMILVEESGRVVGAKNYDWRDSVVIQESLYFKKEFNLIKDLHEPILIDDPFSGKQYIYYKNSLMLERLRLLPLIQFVLIGMLLIAGFLAFRTAKRSEQNLIWVGMAKETAHQLGTPISSLIAWTEILKGMKETSPEAADIGIEIERDVEHLQIVAERFSKIGAKPQLETTDIHQLLEAQIIYMKARASRKISFFISPKPEQPVLCNLNKLLFDWVIENLLKNALDAMEAEGTISIELDQTETEVIIDVSDTGKGIPQNRFKSIFQPGYSTKKRGWGLGLSLTKRVVEEYHQGKIFVKESIINGGTTFEIVLPK